MNFRLATMEDLEALKAMYRPIIKNMHEVGVPIWDDSYPFNFFENDIKNNALYILDEQGKFLSACVLYDTHTGENSVEWMDENGKAFYLGRLGVNVACAKRGVGSLTLTRAKELVKSKGSEYLRLFVVDINKPAIRLYEKNAFTKAAGIYSETIDDAVFHQYGYEIKV